MRRDPQLICALTAAAFRVLKFRKTSTEYKIKITKKLSTVAALQSLFRNGAHQIKHW